MAMLQMNMEGKVKRRRTRTRNRAGTGKSNVQHLALMRRSSPGSHTQTLFLSYSLALTMFRQLGFQPAVAPHNLSAATSAISTIFVRSDLKKKVTPFKMDGADDLMQRAQVANAMWDAVN